MTQEQLIAALNLRIARQMDGEGIWVDASRTLRRPQPDGDGCNWSPCALHVHLSHGPGIRALSTVREVVEWGRLNLELAEPLGV